MKLSQNTKDIAARYVAQIQIQIEKELEFSIPNHILTPLRQRYEHELHVKEKAEKLKLLEAQANEWGMTLTPIQKARVCNQAFDVQSFSHQVNEYAKQLFNKV